MPRASLAPPGGYDQVSALLGGDDNRYGRPPSANTVKRRYAADLAQQVAYQQASRASGRGYCGDAWRSGTAHPGRLQHGDQISLSRDYLEHAQRNEASSSERMSSPSALRRQQDPQPSLHASADAEACGLIQQVSGAPTGFPNEWRPSHHGAQSYWQRGPTDMAGVVASSVEAGTSGVLSPPGYARGGPACMASNTISSLPPALASPINAAGTALMQHDSVQREREDAHLPAEDHVYLPAFSGASHALHQASYAHPVDAYDSPSERSKYPGHEMPHFDHTRSGVANTGGLFGFLQRSAPEVDFEKKARYRADLREQMRQTQARKTQQRQEELAADECMLRRIYCSPSRSIQQAAPRIVQFAEPSVQSGPRIAGSAFSMDDSAAHRLNAARSQYAGSPGLPSDVVEKYSVIDAPENSSAHFNARAHIGPRPPFTGGVSLKGRANEESSLAETPLLRFKSDKTFLTPGELEQRAAAAHELKDALAAQIEEKKQRKAAEAASERALELAELERIDREQEQLAARQREETQRDRKSAPTSQGHVSGAGRKAQQVPETSATKCCQQPSSALSGGGRLSGAGSESHNRQAAREPHGQPLGRDPWVHRLTPALESHVDPFRDEVTSQLEQVRAEIAEENRRMQFALQQQHAEMAGLMERANKFEQQSLAAQHELKTMRAQMQTQSHGAALDHIAFPQAPGRIELPPINQAQQRIDRVLYSRQRGQPSGPSGVVQGAQSAVLAQSPPEHPSRYHGFLPDMQQAGIFLGKAGCSTPPGPRWRHHLASDARDGLEEPLIAQAQFIPVNDPFTPPNQGHPVSQTASVPSDVHTKTGAAAAQRQAGSLRTDMGNAEVGPRSWADGGPQARRRRHWDEPARESPEILEDMLARFVNQGSAASPLYSHSTFIPAQGHGEEAGASAREKEVDMAAWRAAPAEATDSARAPGSASTLACAETTAAQAADTMADAVAALAAFVPGSPSEDGVLPVAAAAAAAYTQPGLPDTEQKGGVPRHDQHNVQDSFATSNYSTLQSQSPSPSPNLETCLESPH